MRRLLPILLAACSVPAPVAPREDPLSIFDLRLGGRPARWQVVASADFRPGTYVYGDADEHGVVQFSGDNIVADFTGVTITGAPDGTPADQFKGIAIRAENCRNLTVKGLTVRGFAIAMYFKNCDGLKLLDCDVSRNYRQRLKSTPRAEDGGDWLFGHENDNNEWFRYGAGIYVESSKKVTVARCRARNGQNGLCLSRVEDSFIVDNDMSFMSGWGLAMWRSSRNDVSNNSFDWCMRGFSHKVYHRGQDSAGILVYEQCHDNVFAYNSATHGGDGFFLYAGNETLKKTGTGGCNRNVLYRNDFSHAAANGIEATFSDGNRFIENRLDECDHGIWGGYSFNTTIVGNTMKDCNHGISIEHGHGNHIERNTFEDNGIAINLWAGANDEFKKTPYGKANDTASHGYVIASNTIKGGRVGIRLGATSDVALLSNVNGATEPVRQEGACENVRDRGSYERAAIEVPKTRGTRNAYLPTGARRGWKTIFVDEWGPYDFTDVRVFPDGIVASGETELTVLGPEGDFTASAEGAEVAPPAGRIPATLTVKSKSSGAFTVTVKARGETATVRGFFLNATWSVRVHRWEPQGAQKPPKDWAAVAASDPVDSFTAAALDFRDRPSEKSPSDHFATVAEAELDLPAGDYEVGTISDDGVRVLVDGAKVIDNWTWHPPHEDTAAVTLAAGKHRVRVEHFEIDGFAQLKFWIKPRLK
jgi:parallel beta-helix repeat protein